MIIFSNISRNKSFARLREAASLLNSQAYSLIADSAADILEEAEEYSLEGNLWRIFLTMRLCEDENVLGRAAELRGHDHENSPSAALAGIAAAELSSLCAVVAKIQKMVNSDEKLALLKPLANYIPSRRAADDGVRAMISGLAEKIFASAESEPERALGHLLSFHAEYGSGIFAMNHAFKWQAREVHKIHKIHKIRKETFCGRLVPIYDLEKFTLGSLVGYEEQKKALLANTEQFLSGGAANNVLLFGDSGTGKSSSIKALLNEPGFTRRGLRVIEVHKEQYREITDILDNVRNRNYRFILFMDDLSFEEFEVEYKYLKAVIEGGLERKPDNVLIYATSNRRNLIREVWKDRKSASDDVHGWDTMQEKHSLAARFGVTIWYGLADKDLYLKMIETMAKEHGLAVSKDELERMALQWEVGRGGYTGRTARQFIQYALHMPKNQK